MAIFNLKKLFYPMQVGYVPKNPGPTGPRGGSTRQKVIDWPYYVMPPLFVQSSIYGSANSALAPKYGPNLTIPVLGDKIMQTGLEKPQTFGDIYY